MAGIPCQSPDASPDPHRTTGLAYDYRTDFFALRNAPDPVQYAMGLKGNGRPAGSWSYNDGAVSLLGPILERANDLPLQEIARRDLFVPLGISQFSWLKDGAGRATAYMGLSLRTRDLLKLASVMSQSGQWQGVSVVPSEWVTESTQRKVGSGWQNPPVLETGYGYLWFTGTLREHQVAWAWGYGGQFALLIPSLRVVIATAATSPPPRELAAQTAAVMEVVTRVVDAAL